jgi:ankyrin repeat protein
MRRVALCVSLALWLGTNAAIAAPGHLPLADAAKSGDVIALRVLLRQHVDVNATEPDGSTALHWASYRGDVDTVDLLMRSGARVTANRYGATPLTLAAESGNAAVVDRLLKGGADPNLSADGGETALMIASRAGRVDAVRTLLAHGANANARESTRQQTALMWAAAEGHADVIRALFQAGADLHAVSGGPQVKLPDFKNPLGQETFERVVPRLDKCTPIQFAVRSGQIEATRELLEAGAGLQDETPQGMGLLSLAIANMHYDLAAFLVQKGADVNAAKVGFTPLHQLVRGRQLNIGQFPRHIATDRTTAVDLGELLLEYGAEVDSRTTKRWVDGYRGAFGLQATPFLLAAKGGDAPLMRLFVAWGADPSAVNANGTTAVMAAAGIEMLNPNEDSGTDADAFAALKLAVALGGDVNAVNKNGDTALHGAVFRATTDAVKFLVDQGAKLDVKNKKGFTPYQYTIFGGGILGSYRPEAGAILRTAMIAHGLKPEAQVDEDRYSFGVKVK